MDAEGDPEVRVLHPSGLERRIAALATRQFGVVTLDQLRDLGLGTRAVQKRVRAGRLHPLHRGVFAAGHRHLSADGRRLAAVLGCGRGALISHRTAADVWRLRRSGSARVDVLVPARGRRSPHGIRLHTTRTLHPDDIAAVRGLPVTSVARTLVDFAATERPEVTERAVHQAEVERVLDVRAVEAAINRNPNRKRVAYLRTLISTPSPGPTHPGLEEDFLVLCRRHGIPDPILNAWVRTVEQPYEVDAFWPAHGLIVELDGAAVHHTRAAFEQDRRRDAALTTEGYAVMRFTHDRITSDAPAVARQLRARTSPSERRWR